MCKICSATLQEMWPGIRRYEEARVMIAARPGLRQKISSRRTRRRHRGANAEILASDDEGNDALEDRVAQAMNEDLGAQTNGNAEDEQFLVDILIEGHHQYVEQHAEQGNEELQSGDQQTDDSDDAADQLFVPHGHRVARRCPRPRRTAPAAAPPPAPEPAVPVATSAPSLAAPEAAAASAPSPAAAAAQQPDSEEQHERIIQRQQPDSRAQKGSRPRPDLSFRGRTFDAIFPKGEYKALCCHCPCGASRHLNFAASMTETEAVHRLHAWCELLCPNTGHLYEAVNPADHSSGGRLLLEFAGCGPPA